MRKSIQLAPAGHRRRPVSVPALVVLGLTLAGLWYGSRALGQTATESFDTAGPAKPSENHSDSNQPPSQPTSATALAQPKPAEVIKSSTPALTAPGGQSGLPSGFPLAIPTPSHATLIKATVAGKTGDQSFVAAYQLTAKPADASASYQQQLKDAGFEVHAVLGSTDAGFFGAQKGVLSLTVSVGADQQATDTTNLTITTSGS